MGYTTRLLAAAVIAALSPVAAAPAQRLPVQPGKWNVDYGNVRCSLSRRTGGPQSPVMILSSYLGEDDPELILMRDGSEGLPELPERLDILLPPGQPIPNAMVLRRRVQGGQVVTLRQLGQGFIDRFAAASQVRLQVRGRALAEVATRGAAAAVAALRACNDDLLRSWGIDPALQPVRPARRLSGSISYGDYPHELAERGVGGTTVVRFVVDRNGQVTSCNISVSSGNALLDSQSCGAIRLRFRYEPARDADGRAIDSLMVQTIRWNPGG